MTQHGLIATNLLGVIEQAHVGTDPYRIDHDGHPYVPVGDGGIVLDLRMGDSVFEYIGDHAAPGVCLTHPNPDAAHALVAQACIGNMVEVRTGLATGKIGAVVGKRGEGGRVIATFPQETLRQLRPGDQIALRAFGQGARWHNPKVIILNIAPQALGVLPVRIFGEITTVEVRALVESRVVGNGIGRPMPMWDVDLQIGPGSKAVANLRLGDLVAIQDLDARYNAGYRKNWVSVGMVIHGSSPQPGHGPGITIFMTGPADLIKINVEETDHQGMTEELLFKIASQEKEF
jgi:hypothetical protein